MDTTLIAFAGVSLLLAVTPGPDMAVVTKNALAHGRRGVLLTTSGIALALVLWVSATAVGLSAVLRASGEGLIAVKIIGALYLAYLGGRALLETRRRALRVHRVGGDDDDCDWAFGRGDHRHAHLGRGL